MNQENIGSFIKDIRKEKGLTQEQLAEKLGVSQKSVSRWETGKTMPDYALLPSICDVLDINVAELLGAERIEGDAVSKKQVTTMAHNMISLMDNRKSIGKIIGAILSVVLTIVCVIGLYNYEFNISVESTADLERAINEYHFIDEVSADILERQAMGNHLYVLYGENGYPGASGLACLEKGIFGKYRILSCEDSKFRWINATKVTEKKTRYCITWCVENLSGIDSYGLCGVKEEPGKNLSVDDAELIYQLPYNGIPFLTFTEIEDGVTIAPYQIKYFIDSTEIPRDMLTDILGEHEVDGAPNSGTGTAELGMLYVLEGIIILLGVVFVRYFLVEEKTKRARK